MTTPQYAEIGITTNFSFLRGGSDPRAYVHEASRLNIPVIGIADHNTLAGVVRAWNELDNPAVINKPKFLIGARLVFIDGTPDILVYPRDRAAYGLLCQLLTRGKRGSDGLRSEGLNRVHPQRPRISELAREGERLPRGVAALRRNDRHRGWSEQV